MDEQLRRLERTNEVSVLDWLRAGRLAPAHVALAAYLGDPRALATGVQPWAPTSSASVRFPVACVVSEAELTDRQRVWLACTAVLPRRQLPPGPGPLQARLTELGGAVFDAVCRWCEGRADLRAVVEVFRPAEAAYHKLMFEDHRSEGRPNPTLYMEVAWLEEDVSLLRERGAPWAHDLWAAVGPLAAGAISLARPADSWRPERRASQGLSFLHEACEAAPQTAAQAVADVLLNPHGFPSASPG